MGASEEVSSGTSGVTASISTLTRLCKHVTTIKLKLLIGNDFDGRSGFWFIRPSAIKM